MRSQKVQVATKTHHGFCSLHQHVAPEITDVRGSRDALLATKPQVVVPSFYNIISNDEDTLKIVVQIMNGMSASAAELQKYLSYWDKYKYIWENDKACPTKKHPTHTWVVALYTSREASKIDAQRDQ